MTTYISSKMTTGYSFSNNDLGIVSRELVLSKLIPFDKNKDGLFDQIQIQNALSDLLSGSPQKSHQVFKNALQYDSNKDQKLTYDQLTNFVVQFYFGQTQVKYLHSKQMYSEGGKRIMTQQQFIKTLHSCLSIIKIKAEDDQIGRLYEAVDRTKRGYITFEQYSSFLSQYFGKESAAAKSIIAPKAGQSISSMKVEHVKLEEVRQKIGRLIFSQLRVTLMKYDLNRSLNLTKDQVKMLLSQVFGLITSEQQQFLKNIFPTGDPIKYEDAMREAVLFYTCDVYFRGEHKDLVSIKSELFVEMVRKAFFFLKVKPSPYDLQLLFLKTDKDFDNRISRTEYVKMLENILRNYEF